MSFRWALPRFVFHSVAKQWCPISNQDKGQNDSHNCCWTFVGGVCTALCMYPWLRSLWYDTILAFGCGMLLTRTPHALFCAEPDMEAKYLQKLLVGVLILAAKAKANTGKNFDMEHIFHFSALWLESVTRSGLTNLFLIHHWLKKYTAES